MKRILVTEGPADAALMMRVLSSAGLYDIKVLVGGGKSSAISLGTSLALNRDNSIAILVDADTIDPRRMKEQLDIFNDLLPRGISSGNCKLFLAAPTLEEELFPSLDELKKAFPAASVRASIQYPSDWNKIAKLGGIQQVEGDVTTSGVPAINASSLNDVMSKPVMIRLVKYLKSV